MKNRYWRLWIFILLYPYIVGFSPNSSDTSSTEIEFAVGYGSYVDVRERNDCKGTVSSVEDFPFQEAGVSIQHKFSIVNVGASGGITTGNRDHFLGDAKTVGYINPKIGLNTKDKGLDVGYFLVLNPSIPGSRFPNGLLRLGNLDGWYYTIGVANNLPLLTGGGLVDLGLGFNLGKPRSKLWLGFAAYPYDAAVISAKGDFPMTESFILNVKSQFGLGKNLEYGLALGGKVVF